jgi:hypothetical protein
MAASAPAPASRRRGRYVVGAAVAPSATQRVYELVGAVGTPFVALLSLLLGRRPRPCATKLPTRCVRAHAAREARGARHASVRAQRHADWACRAATTCRRRRVGDTNYKTSPQELEAALAALVAAAPGWAATPLARRAELARDCARRAQLVAEAMTADAVAYKGAYEVGDGEEMAVWAATPAVLVDLARSLDALAAGTPRAPVALRWRAGGQAVARVFPDSLFEHLLFSGYSGELWLEPGAVPSHGGAVVRGGPGEVCLVLGAGNQAVVAVADVALKCLVHGAACILKMNPVNEWAGPHMERTLQPLIAAGALRIVYGGAEVGKALTAHAAIQTARAFSACWPCTACLTHRRTPTGAHHGQRQNVRRHRVGRRAQNARRAAAVPQACVCRAGVPDAVRACTGRLVAR